MGKWLRALPRLGGNLKRVAAQLCRQRGYLVGEMAAGVAQVGR